MGVEIEVGGVVFAEVEAQSKVVQRSPGQAVRRESPQRQEFLGRMENWRKVVRGAGGAVDSSASYCAGWAKLYVKLRTSEAPPDGDIRDEKIKPLSPLVSVDELDGWLVEAAWRTLGDYNARQALKCLYIQRWPACKIRDFLNGVRGRHVPLVIAKAERDLQAVLAKVGGAAMVYSSAIENNP
jgi:hypothetical protein